jgi:hypothetical protein
MRITPERLAIAALALGTGTALFVYLVARVSIVAGLVTVLVLAGGAVAVVWRRLPAERRRAARGGVVAGLLAGVPALLAYDGTRWALVTLFPLPVRPFDAIPLFGQLFWSQDAASPLTDVTGVLYHVCNGLGFAVAYTVLLGRRGVLAGIAWGLVLEAAMLTVYPGWLDIRALREFFGVSVLGHLAYGAVLGWTARRLLTRDPDPAFEVHP